MIDFNRRAFLKGISAGVVTAGMAKALAAVQDTEHAKQDPSHKRRPNFLFILTDDQRYDAMACAGNPLIHTPNIDSLAARGVRFENAFVTLSICSPSRAACLTGRYGSANGVTSVPGTLNKDEKTTAQRFKEVGYRTGVVGKWHLGNSPAECGFDFAATFVSNGTYYNRQVRTNGTHRTAPGYIEDYNAQKAVEFLEDGSSPFFLWLYTQVPHMNSKFDWPARDETLAAYDEDRMPVPQTWDDNLEGKPDYLRQDRNCKQALRYGYDKKENIRRHFRKYFAVITEMDAAIGRVLAALDKLGLRENTYILFMGDNGWFMGEHGLTSKVLPYEESIRVPMIIAGPGIEPAADDHLVLNIDLAPTMLELATLPVPANMHGSSLVPLLKKRAMKWRHSFLYEAPTPSLGSRPLLALRTPRYKFVQTFDIGNPSQVVFEELYDLQQDPKETTNLAGKTGYLNIMKELRRELKRRQDEIKP